MRLIYTKNFRRGFILFILLAALIVADATNLLSPVKSSFLESYGAASRLMSRAGAGLTNTLRTLFLLKNLSWQNDRLQQTVDELSFENARLKLAKQENTALRRALGFAEDTEFNVLAARVIVADPTGFTQTIIIDKGAHDAVTEGLSVIAAPGLLVGRVSKVYATTAEVTLLTDPNLTVNAEVPESGAVGLIRGEHGLSLKFDLITHNELIKPGDKLITSGLAGDYPRGLLIGDISSVQSSSSELFQKAYVSPAANLRTLRIIFIIRP